MDIVQCPSTYRFSAQIPSLTSHKKIWNLLDWLIYVLMPLFTFSVPFLLLSWFRPPGPILSQCPKLLLCPILCFLNLSSTPPSEFPCQWPCIPYFVSNVVCPNFQQQQQRPPAQFPYQCQPIWESTHTHTGQGNTTMVPGQSRVRLRIVKSSLVQLKAVQCSPVKPIWCQFIASKLQNQCKSSSLQSNVIFGASENMRYAAQQQQSLVSSRWRETPSSLSLLPPSESNCVTLHSTSLCFTALRGNLMPCNALHCIVGHVSRWEQPPTAAAATAMEGNLRQIRSSPSSSESKIQSTRWNFDLFSVQTYFWTFNILNHLGTFLNWLDIF